MKQKNYSLFNLKFLDRIISMKRLEIFYLIKNNINNAKIKQILDIGTTEEDSLESSNFFVKKFKNIKIKKSITDQSINKSIFNNTLQKSITKNFSKSEITKFSSDLVISSATIEHVGNYRNQIKMIKNIMLLTKKFFFITTPSRKFPVDFHTKLPLIHLLPKQIHRLILKLLFLKEYSKEENLNLLDEYDIKEMIKKINNKKFEIKIMKIKLVGITSNLIIFGKLLKL